MPDEAHAAQDEGPHHDLGEVRLGRQHPPELQSRDPDQPGVGLSLAADEGFAPVQEVGLAGELPRPVDREDVPLAIRLFVERLHRVTEQQAEIGGAIAAPVEERAGRHRFLRAVLGDPRDHAGVEAREGLGLPQIRVRLIERRRHRGLAGHRHHRGFPLSSTGRLRHRLVARETGGFRDTVGAANDRSGFGTRTAPIGSRNRYEVNNIAGWDHPGASCRRRDRSSPGRHSTTPNLPEDRILR